MEPQKISDVIAGVRVTPMPDSTPMGVARWQLRQARSIEPDLAEAMRLVEAAHTPEAPRPQAYPARGYWPVQSTEWVPDTSVEEAFVRRTIALLDAAESRQR